MNHSSKRIVAGILLTSALACSLVVAAPAAEQLLSDGTSATYVAQAKTYKIKVGYTYKITTKKWVKRSKVKWSSTKPSVASVTKKGYVTGKKVGKAKIRAKYKGKVSTITVKVKK